MLCRLYQQVWLLCCVVSISKCDFYAVSSPSASVTSVVSCSSSNVTSILCGLHQQVWLLCRFVCVSWRDFYAVPCLSASVSSMLCRLRQQAFTPDVRGCRQVNVLFLTKLIAPLCQVTSSWCGVGDGFHSCQQKACQNFSINNTLPCQQIMLFHCVLSGFGNTLSVSFFFFVLLLKNSIVSMMNLQRILPALSDLLLAFKSPLYPCVVLGKILWLIISIQFWPNQNFNWALHLLWPRVTCLYTNCQLQFLLIGSLQIKSGFHPPHSCSL